MIWSVITNIIDLFIVGAIIYFLLNLIKGTRAVQLIKGLVLIFIASVVSQLLNLNTVHWFLQSVLTMLIVALPIVFHPELRRALEQLGRGGFLSNQLVHKWSAKDINEIIMASDELAEEKTGALIVFENEVGLRDYIETGTEINAQISKELIENLFYKSAPLHDGAVIVGEGRVKAAGCLLNLSNKPSINPKLGTRHRAAIGITEESDAIVIVVSEESGVISLAQDGELIRYLDKSKLREILFKEFVPRKTNDFFS
ncbi:MAG TPA: diadenylate cyclase CdaA [Halanaerobiales bacterium]|nr:diadenylate cyclase CdaA [Halanaerobiales bacterium]